MLVSVSFAECSDEGDGPADVADVGDILAGEDSVRGDTVRRTEALETDEDELKGDDRGDIILAPVTTRRLDGFRGVNGVMALDKEYPSVSTAGWGILKSNAGGRLLGLLCPLFSELRP